MKGAGPRLGLNRSPVGRVVRGALSDWPPPRLSHRWPALSLGWARQQATAPAVAATPACEVFTCAVQPAPLSVRSDTGTVGLPRA